MSNWLSPSQLAAMKLNGGRHWPEVVASPCTRAASTYPSAYGRIVSTPLVAGYNQSIGDCFPTGCTNAVQTLLGRAGNYTPISDDVAVQAYEGMTNYIPSDPATDQGTDPTQGFTWWASNPIAGYKLQSINSISPVSEGEIRSTIAMIGGVLLCVELSVANQNQRVWMPDGQAGSWGGHAIWCDQYDGDVYRVTSWGDSFYISRDFFNTSGFVIGVWGLNLIAA